MDTNFTNLNNDKYESGDNVSVGTLTASGNVTFGIAATVSAAGSTQGTATALTKTYNIVSTASASQGVVLPAATAGLIINVFNISGNTIKVYPTSTQTIDGGSANAPVEIVTANGSEFVGTGTGTWRQVGSGGNNVEDFTINGTAKLLGALELGVTAAVSSAGSGSDVLILLRLSITSQLLVHQLRVWFYQQQQSDVIVANTTTSNCKLYLYI